MIKRMLTAVALAAAMATPAFAQVNKPDTAAQSTPPASSASAFVQSQHATDWRGSKLIGASVYGPDDASIGSVTEVLLDNEGRIRAVVIGVGGFLGVGEKNVAVPFDALSISRKPESSSIDKITVSYGKEELQNAPAFAYYEAPTSPATGLSVTEIKSMRPMSSPLNNGNANK